MATLTVTETEDYRDGDPGLDNNIEFIVFDTVANATATFNSHQWDGFGIFENVNITGDGFTNVIRVTLTFNSTFSAAAWTFDNWTGGDRVVLEGTAADNTITGTDGNDILIGFEGQDHLFGGAGDDTFEFDAGNVVAEEEIDGGTQATTGDTIKLRTLGASDFSGAIINGIESLLMTSSVTGTFNGDQLRLGAITQVTGLASATQAIIVKDDDVNLRNVSFSNWGAATQTVTITGTSGTANTLIGSNQKDTINGFGSSADTMTGGGGADALNGSNGPDTFVYVAPTDIVAGEAVSGGSNIDTLRFQRGAGTLDFRPVSLTSIEQFQFWNNFGSGASRAIFAPSQFGGTGISDNVAVQGDANANTVSVIMPAQGTFSAAGWSFSDWSNNDDVEITGTSGEDIITGSARRDRISAANGRDTISAGAGADIILVDSNDIVAGEEIDGGTGADPLELDILELTSTGTTDLSPLESLDNVEVLLLGQNGTTVILTRDELVSEVWGAGGGSFTQAFILNTNSASLSSVFFENWGGANQTITINGTSGTANSLSGSSERDTINGLGTSADSMRGGGGADILNGNGGDDRFGYLNPGDVVLGETVNGGPGSDLLAFIYDGTTDFRNAVLTSIERVLFSDENSPVAVFASSQFGGTGISNALLLNGNGGSNSNGRLEVRISDTEVFSAKEWTFTGWSNFGDSIVLIGSEKGESIIGSSEDDVIQGGPDADTLDGLDGTDTASYAEKIASLFVVLNGATNSSVLVGGVAEDTIRNIENVTGGSGDDSMTGDELANTFLGGDGNDVMRGGASNDVIDGGIGTVDAADYRDKTAGIFVALNGTTTTSVLVNGIAEDTVRNVEKVFGGTGDDSMTGDELANTFLGGDGNDVMRGGASNDVIDGGIGTVDAADYRDKTAGIFVALNGTTTTSVLVNGIAEDTVRNVEKVFGGTGNDSMTGDGLANTFLGGDGNDVMRGGAGNDVIDGGIGTVDAADYRDKTAGIFVALNGATTTSVLLNGVAEDTVRNVEKVFGGSGDDSMTGDGLANSFIGGDGNDTMRGGAGNDVIDGGAGIADVADYRDKAAAVSVTLSGATTATVLVGGVAEDTVRNVEKVYGGSGADTLTGDALSNLFLGGGGSDRLAGMLGNDVVDGGLGNDTLVFNTALGATNLDTILNYNVANDMIELENGIFIGLGAGTLTAGAFNTGTAATQADDRILFDTGTGRLFFDQDGLGGVAAKQFATLGAGLVGTVSSGDFLVV